MSVTDQPAASSSAKRIVVINAGTGSPSTTRQIADRLAQSTLDLLAGRGHEVTVSAIDIAPLAVNIARASVAGFADADLQHAIDRLASADAVIAATPVYKAGMSGLFKSFIDVLDNDLLVAKPMLLAATGGTARHALIIDEQLRPLFAFMRALTLPTSIYVSVEDWATAELSTRINRAATELAAAVHVDIEREITDASWGAYHHQFAGSATRAERSADDIDFDSDLMRLATGGSTRAAE